LDPWHQWVRDHLPNGQNGVVYNLDDGILRTFERGKAGVWCPLEAKSNGKEPGFADRESLRAISEGVALHPLLIQFDGDVPTPVVHWPRPCFDCGAPGPVPRPSTKVIIKVQGGHRTPTRTVKLPPNTETIRGWLMRYMQHPTAATA